MPKVYKLEGTKRDGIGKKAVKNLRREKYKNRYPFLLIVNLLNTFW